MAELAAIERKANEHVVRKLEELLVMARKGEVVSLTCSTEITGGLIDTYTNSRDLVVMLGHLARQTHIVNLALDKSAAEL